MVVHNCASKAGVVHLSLLCFSPNVIVFYISF